MCICVLKKVELSGGDDDDNEEGCGPQRITVGMDDVVRVMPWFCIEVLLRGHCISLCPVERNLSVFSGNRVNYYAAK